jgi:hypothetical protein
MRGSNFSYAHALLYISFILLYSAYQYHVADVLSTAPTQLPPNILYTTQIKVENMYIRRIFI